MKTKLTHGKVSNSNHRMRNCVYVKNENKNLFKAKEKGCIKCKKWDTYLKTKKGPVKGPIL